MSRGSTSNHAQTALEMNVTFYEDCLGSYFVYFNMNLIMIDS